VSRYRNAGVPIWASSPVVDEAGLAKAQDIMVLGGVLPADKTVPYAKLVTTAYAGKAATKTDGR
jgi:NitT/TauT family transport system substrate-binding protein